MDTKNISNYAIKYTFWRKHSPKHDHGTQDGGFPWCIPMSKVSLNDAFLVGYISKGLTRNRCHVTAIDMIGKRTSNLDREVFCCKCWSKIISYLNKHELWPKYGLLSQWWLHTKSKKTPRGVLAVLSSSWRHPVCAFWAKLLNESWCQIQ